ncbi:tetratricopeptide repeat protein [Pedosphaera parvula]|uniref:Tetratricopeptide TPR_2 repeat protein n=1 Tax=Pedosphaera parvula (strain Ellin514) TaxID=320771 RepID=B9XHE6_PEDPL|nr:tetratricopeptide repeat protein [Pedosphaera parvula]EEF60781.1 Tetratricopeptide TPR_2 repeat protein [Pedosphaera parvula Ellin514]
MKSKIYVPILIFLTVLVAGVAGGMMTVRFIRNSQPIEKRIYPLLKEKRYDQAVKELTREIENNPKDEWAYACRAYVFSEMTNYDKALSDYTAAIALNPHNCTNYFRRAYVYLRKGDWTNEISDFNKCIQEDPEYFTAYVDRGLVYAERKEFDHAMDDFNEALRLKPRSAMVYAYRAGIYAARTNYDDALKDCNTAVKLSPRWSMPYNRRGALYSTMGRDDEALKDFRVALQFGKRDEESCNNLAWLLATSQDAAIRNGQEAVDLAKRACELTKWQENRTLDTLASAYAECGDFEKAVKYQKQALATKDIPKESLKVEEGRLVLYEKHEPYRRDPKKSGND